mmetsp:Transcript_15586/g.23248  ORF Transcript_15586/g.23248 Transcript_15586/m.23248 type:complete len:123 (-) Transcript_15586:323-691(-)
MNSRGIALGNDANASDGKASGNDSTPTTRRRRTLPSLPRELDIFGFYLSPKHTLILILLAFVMFGLIGSLIFMGALGVYTYSQRSSQNAGQKSSGNLSRGKSWGGGANIKGVKDLPQDPKGG